MASISTKGCHSRLRSRLPSRVASCRPVAQNATLGSTRHDVTARAQRRAAWSLYWLSWRAPRLAVLTCLRGPTKRDHYLRDRTERARAEVLGMANDPALL